MTPKSETLEIGLSGAAADATYLYVVPGPKGGDPSVTAYVCLPRRGCVKLNSQCVVVCELERAASAGMKRAAMARQ